MKPLSERIKDFPANQFVDWLCLSCVDVREVNSEEDAQDEINKIRQAVTERLTVLEQQRDALQEKFDFKQNLTEQIVELQKQRDALAAENASMMTLAVACEKEFGSYTVEEFPDDTKVSYPEEQCNITFGMIRQALNKTATDAYLNSVRAEAIPEGYVLVPQQMHLSADAMESLCFHCGDGGFAFGDFTDGLLWVGDIENDDGSKTYGLNIATAEYADEGSANISEFAAQLRAAKDGE